MTTRTNTISLLLIVTTISLPSRGAERPPSQVVAEDRPNDKGQAIVARWKAAGGNVRSYEVFRVDPSGDRNRAGMVSPQDLKLVDTGKQGARLRDGVVYRYVVKAVFADGSEAESEMSAPVVAAASWFHWGRLANLAAVAFFAALFFVLTRRARSGDVPYVRPIAGLTALSDSVGRAAEMGRPILYVPGLQDAAQPATVAALSILSEVTRKAARLRTRVKVPNYSPLTWPVAQNVVKEAYLRAGRPEDFSPDDVTYLTSRSFTFTAAVIGMMIRERTATNFLIGHFYSESLILAETGAATGAVQIGGTDSETQLPFFITTCDYTMIGEELFAAASEVSGDPIARSTIAVHDWFKVAAMVLIVTGLVLGLLDAVGVDGARDMAKSLAALLRESK